MRKKLLSLALALVMCLGLTVPAFAATIDVTYSVDPIGVATIQGAVNTFETVYVFDQDVLVTPKDGRSFTRFYCYDVNFYGSFEGYDGPGDVSGDLQLLGTGIAQVDKGLWGVMEFEVLDSANGVLDSSPFMTTKAYIDELIAEGVPVDFRPYTATQPTGGPQVSDWAKEQVNRAVENGLVPDSLGNDYRVSITRAEFAATAVKLYEAMSGQKSPAAGESPFTDTSDTAVIQAQALGIVSGVGDGKFAPDALVTREQAAAMLSRVYTRLGGNIPEVADTTFADNDKVSGWARDAVAFMADKGIVSGVGNNQFSPQGNASIEQALVIALRIFDNLK